MRVHQTGDLKIWTQILSLLVTSCVREVVPNSLGNERTKEISTVHPSLNCLYFIFKICPQETMLLQVTEHNIPILTSRILTTTLVYTSSAKSMFWNLYSTGYAYLVSHSRSGRSTLLPAKKY